MYIERPGCSEMMERPGLFRIDMKIPAFCGHSNRYRLVLGCRLECVRVAVECVHVLAGVVDLAAVDAASIELEAVAGVGHGHVGLVLGSGGVRVGYLADAATVELEVGGETGDLRLLICGLGRRSGFESNGRGESHINHLQCKS